MEKKFPDDFVKYASSEKDGVVEHSWYIDLDGSSNGKRVFLVFDNSKVRVREMEFYDGFIERDEEKEYSHKDYRSGLLDEWINKQLGEFTRSKILSEYQRLFSK